MTEEQVADGQAEKMPTNARSTLKDRTWWIVFEGIGIPIALIIIGSLFTVVQDNRQNTIADNRLTAEATQEANRIAAQNEIEASREAAQIAIEDGRTQDNVLQLYLDKMTDLMRQVDFASIPRLSCENQPEERADSDIQEIEIIARSRTLVTLNQLTDQHRVDFLRFLSEAQLLGLINCDLSKADWAGENLQGITLSYVKLREADLSGADLSGADLFHTDMREADLRGANLIEADLTLANLSEANLSRADMSRAFLYITNLSEANLAGATLTDAIIDNGTTLPDGSKGGSGTDMSRFTDLPEHSPESSETPAP